MNHVKKSIGASHISWWEHGGAYGLKVIIKGKETLVNVGGTPRDVTVEQYKNLINQFLGLNEK